MLLSIRTIYPALCALRLCDANILAKDKIYHLVKRVDYTLLSSLTIEKDESLFKPRSGALCNGVSEEMSTVFG